MASAASAAKSAVSTTTAVSTTMAASTTKAAAESAASTTAAESKAESAAKKSKKFKKLNTSKQRKPKRGDRVKAQFKVGSVWCGFVGTVLQVEPHIMRVHFDDDGKTWKVHLKSGRWRFHDANLEEKVPVATTATAATAASVTTTASVATVVPVKRRGIKPPPNQSAKDEGMEQKEMQDKEEEMQDKEEDEEMEEEEEDELFNLAGLSAEQAERCMSLAEQFKLAAEKDTRYPCIGENGAKFTSFAIRLLKAALATCVGGQVVPYMSSADAVSWALFAALLQLGVPLPQLPDDAAAALASFAAVHQKKKKKQAKTTKVAFTESIFVKVAEDWRQMDQREHRNPAGEIDVHATEVVSSWVEFWRSKVHEAAGYALDVVEEAVCIHVPFAVTTCVSGGIKPDDWDEQEPPLSKRMRRVFSYGTTFDEWLHTNVFGA
jgi:hypothetical protein